MIQSIRKWLGRYGVSIAVFALVMGLVLASLPSVTEHARQERLRMAEDTLRRAVVTCYALEGRYPPDLEYLRANYGLQLRDEDYIVHYDIFAENIMPEITVLER